MTSTTTEFRRGAIAAAAVAEMYNSSSVHAYRLDDCILAKMNITSRKTPRKNKKKLQDPEVAWIAGYAVALAESHRRLAGGNDSTGVCEVARAACLTLARARAAGVSPYDLKELKKAGVR